MTKRKDLRNQLGLTQQQTALLLGISRVHYSLFETGRRTIPIEAEARLAKLTAAASEIATKRKDEIFDSDRQNEAQLLREFLKENQFQQSRTQIAIERLAAKQQASQSKIALQKHLGKNKKSAEAAKSKATLRGLSASFNQQAVKTLLKLEIKLEVLGFEMSILERRLYSREQK